MQLEGLPSWPLDDRSYWCPSRESNPKSSPYQGDILPLNDRGLRWCGREELNLQLSRSERAASTFFATPAFDATKQSLSLGFVALLVPAAGLEPANLRLSTVCLCLSARRALPRVCTHARDETGAGRRTRTCFPRFTKPLHVLTCSTGMVPMNGVEPLLALYKGATLPSVTGILRGDAVIEPPIRRKWRRALILPQTPAGVRAA